MRSKKLRTLTPEAFALLLHCLDADREQAAVKYEEVRRALMTFFAFRNATDPTALADETLNRVAYRLAEGQEITTDNPLYYFYAVARNVWRETLAQAHHSIPFSDLTTMPRAPSAEELRAELTVQHLQDQRLTCLEQCLHKLPEEDRRILLEYHQGQGQAKITRRQALAAQLGITSGSLRNRTCRIRDRLAACIRACVGEDV
jgi:DNA-directed RNA polymerase specialized sigma24 family protein